MNKQINKISFVTKGLQGDRVVDGTMSLSQARSNYHNEKKILISFHPAIYINDFPQVLNHLLCHLESDSNQWNSVFKIETLEKPTQLRLILDKTLIKPKGFTKSSRLSD